MKKLVLGIATLTLAVASAAEKHNITLFQPSVVNGTTLKPGEYKLEIAGDKVTIKNGKNVVEAPVRVEAGDAKFGSTAVRYSNGNGEYKVQEIRIGGTKTRLIFGSDTRPAGE